ncbi:hypothetical protein FEE95_17075 [Maribacter algarum]|uniref:Uncharacterized protein n=1 Tax=Maribacter algarum (ex Zhang et al. 2020) TaxID=2578118 RepID=A0A5S3PH81_9FLAO|nr:hypothetical protein [Maribacter algarum]TMM53615.1 hypothetical protein FEE95_17075 [Maribacter algarum]
MKKAFTIVLLISSAIAFAQQSPKTFSGGVFNYNSNTPGITKPSLNMTPFKLEDFMGKTNSLTERLRKSNRQREKPVDNMPIFAPEGKFFLKIYKVDEDIDHKLKIFEFEQSKYNSRNLG